MAKRRAATQVAVRRSSTGTPLGKRLAAIERRVDRIPWASFDRARYAEPALALAAHAARSLALGEYGAIHLFSRLASSLSLVGAPLDVVRATTLIPSDEARHAEYALRLAELMSGGPVELTLAPAELPKDAWRPLDQEDIDATMIETAAVAETLAAALIGACRDRASEPVARAFFGALLADEVHHARVGWYYLEWRAPQWSLAEKQRLADRIGGRVASIEVQFGQGRDAPKRHAKAARALGVLDTPGQRRVIQSIMKDEIVPALDALGLGASHAWQGRARIQA